MNRWTVIGPGYLGREDPLGQRGKLMFGDKLIAYLYAEGDYEMVTENEEEKQFNILGDGSL